MSSPPSINTCYHYRWCYRGLMYGNWIRALLHVFMRSSLVYSYSKPYFKRCKAITLWHTSYQCHFLFALATANALGQLLSYYNVSTQCSADVRYLLPYKWQFLLAVIAFYLFLGTFMDAIPAMILFRSCINASCNCIWHHTSPVRSDHRYHTGEVGQVTPPYGLCLLIAGRISGNECAKVV